MSDQHIGREKSPITAPATQPSVIQETTPLDLIQLAHRHLAGRYRIAIPLALGLAALGATSAFFLLKPMYVSTGMLQVAPISSALTMHDDAPAVSPRYDSFVSAQATLIASRTVIDRALESEELMQAGWPTGNQGIEKLADSLQIGRAHV